MDSINPRVYLLMAILGSLLLAAPAYAQGGYGTSSITLGQNGTAIMPGHQATVQYTVNLATGETWGTNVSISDEPTLSTYGINVSLSSSTGEPPFSGVATITTNASTPINVYQIQFIATGDDPTSRATVFTLNVSNSAPATVTTTMVTNITSPGQTTSISYNPGGGQSYPSSSSTPLYVSILAVIVLFLVIIIALKFS